MYASEHVAAIRHSLIRGGAVVIAIAALALVGVRALTPRTAMSGLEGGWTGTVSNGRLRAEVRLCLRAGASTVDLPGFGYYDLAARVEHHDSTATITFSVYGSSARITLRPDGDAAAGAWEGAGAPGQVQVHRSTECGPRYRAVRFDVRRGGHTLAGTLLLPLGSGRHPAVVWTHGSGHVTRNDPIYRGLAVALTELGVASLIYDKQGVGESTGDYAAAGMRELAADAVAAVEQVGAHRAIDAALVGVGGISQGGWVTPTAAALSPAVRFVVGLSAPGITPAEQNLFNQHNKIVNAGFSTATALYADSLLREIYRYYRTGSGRHDLERALRSISGEPWFEAAYELAIWHRRGLMEGPVSPTYLAALYYDPTEFWPRVTVPSILIWGAADDLVPAGVSDSVIRQSLHAAGNRDATYLAFPRAGHTLRLPPEAPWTWGVMHPGYRAAADFILRHAERSR